MSFWNPFPGELNFNCVNSKWGGDLCGCAWEKGYNKAAAAVGLHFVPFTKKALGLWPTSSRTGIMLLVSNAAIMVVFIILVNFILTVFVVTFMSKILPRDYWAPINILTVYARCWFACCITLFDRFRSGVLKKRRYTVKGPAVIYLSPSLSPYFSISLSPTSFWCETDRASSTAARCQAPANGINMVDG